MKNKYLLIRKKNVGDKIVPSFLLLIVILGLIRWIKSDYLKMIQEGIGWYMSTYILIGWLIIMIIKDLLKKETKEEVELIKNKDGVEGFS